MLRTRQFALAFVIMAALIISVLPASTVIAGDETEQTTLTIKGMTCGGCVGAVKAQLKKTEGVTEYEVSDEKGEADVSFDPRQTDPETIAASVSKTGFKASVKGEDAGEKNEDHPTG